MNRIIFILFASYIVFVLLISSYLFVWSIEIDRSLEEAIISQSILFSYESDLDVFIDSLSKNNVKVQALKRELLIEGAQTNNNLGGKYFIHIKSFSNKRFASRYVRKMNKIKGVDSTKTFLYYGNESNLFKALLGPFDNKISADEAIMNGIEGIVVKMGGEVVEVQGMIVKIK